MKNLEIFIPLENGEQLSLDYRNGRELIDDIISDTGVTPLSLCFEAITNDGKNVRITIPYNDSDKVNISID